MKLGTFHSEKTKKKISENIKKRFENPKYKKQVLKTSFKKGFIPWNKNLKGIHLSPKTEFDGSFNGDKHPSWKGGIQKPKGDCIYVWSGINKRKRRPRVIYEEHFGKIPKGYVIYHKDKNKLNDDISNLIAISRAELVKLNNGGN